MFRKPSALQLATFAVLCGFSVVCFLVGVVFIVQYDDDNTTYPATIPEATNGAIDTAIAATFTKTA